MKIGIEGQRLFRNKKHGMDFVALQLIRELQKIDLENQYFIYVKPDEDSACLQETENFKIVEIEGWHYPKWEQIDLPRQAKRDGCDLLHCTSNTAPKRCALPLVVTLHDIIYMEKGFLQILTGSGTAYQKFGNMYRRMVVPRVVKKADQIITVSDFEKKNIADYFGVRDERLQAVYNGVSEHFQPITNEVLLRQIKEQYKLPDRFFFFLGNTDPKKNTSGVLSAFSEYRKKAQEDYKLVMIDFDEDELAKLLDHIGDPTLRKHIHLLGYVVNSNLPAIYSLCEIFLYPSLRESFGIPQIEAMRCGVPVIASNTSAMPEVSGGAALLVDPYKPEEITRAIFEIQNNNNLRQSLIEKGIERSKQFSWKNMAEHVFEIYKRFA